LPETAWVVLPRGRHRRTLRAMGEWVVARCQKRAEEHEKPMPQEVKNWLDDAGNSEPDRDTAAPAKVLYWLVKTIDDPAWPDLSTK